MPIVSGPNGLENLAYILQGDPTVTGFQAPVGSLGYSYTTSLLYFKSGDAPTAWAVVGLPNSSGIPLSTVCTVNLDLTQTIDNVPLPVPVRPGFFYMPLLAKLLIYSSTGTPTAGTLTVSYGNAATHDNGGISSLSPASYIAVAAAQPAYIAIGSGTTNPPEVIDAAAPYFAKITTVLTGVTAAHGRLVVIGCWLPTS